MRNGTTPVAEREPATTAPATAPRVPKRGLGSKLSGGHLLMIVAGFVAFVATFALLSNRGATVTVAVAERDLDPGTELTADAVRAQQIPADTPIANQLLRYDEVKDGGRFAARRIAEGEPLTSSAVTSTLGDVADQRLMSIPVEQSRAAAGEIAVGDTIDVMSVADGRSCKVVAGAQVLKVSEPSSGGFGGGSAGSGGYSVLVAVPSGGEYGLAEAIDAGKIQLVKTTGAAESTPDDCGSGSARMAPSSTSTTSAR